jgi:hypothetical protein
LLDSIGEAHTGGRETQWYYSDDARQSEIAPVSGSCAASVGFLCVFAPLREAILLGSWGLILGDRMIISRKGAETQRKALGFVVFCENCDNTVSTT